MEGVLVTFLISVFFSRETSLFDPFDYFIWFSDSHSNYVLLRNKSHVGSNRLKHFKHEK